MQSLSTTCHYFATLCCTGEVTDQIQLKEPNPPDLIYLKLIFQPNDPWTWYYTWTHLNLLTGNSGLGQSTCLCPALLSKWLEGDYDSLYFSKEMDDFGERKIWRNFKKKLNDEKYVIHYLLFVSFSKWSPLFLLRNAQDPNPWGHRKSSYRLHPFLFHSFSISFLLFILVLIYKKWLEILPSVIKFLLQEDEYFAWGEDRSERLSHSFPISLSLFPFSWF
jgi:hypothetical protein